MKALLIAILLSNFLSLASQKPYVPSYDDWYEDDLKQASANKNYFKEPKDELNYAEYHYVGAHAAEKYPRFFSEYILQEQPLPGILATGVRGLMLSAYNWSLNWSSLVRDGRSIVCSRPTLETTTFMKNGSKLYQTLHYEMNRVFNFLKAHPQAVITIVFDDRCDMGKMVRDIKEIIFKNNYDPILKQSDWKLLQQKNEWPTLGWMRKNNKRLVLFTQIYREHTDFTYPIESYFWENNYGTTDVTIACGEDKELVTPGEKRNRTLASFGCFGSVAVTNARNYRRCFDYDFVKNLTTSCRKRKFARGRTFNGYWADHVIDATNDLIQNKRKTAFDYVNELNAEIRK